MTESLDDFAILLAQLRDSTVDLLAHSVDEMRAGSILADILANRHGLRPVQKLKELLVVHGVIETSRQLLDDGQNLGRLQKILRDIEEHVDEVILSNYAVCLGIDAAELVLELLSQISRGAAQVA